MNWFKKLFKNASYKDNDGWFYDWLTQGKSDAGISVNEVSAWNASAVYAAINIISSTIASLPLDVYRRLPRGKEKIPNHPLYRLLHDQPNPNMSSMVYRETQQSQCLSWGNMYAEIQRDGNTRPIALWPLQPGTVTPELDDNNTLRYKITDPAGVRYLRSIDVIHIPDMGFNGVVGQSRIRLARQTVGLNLAAEKFGSTFFGNGAHTSGVLEHPSVLGPEGIKTLKETWLKNTSGDNQNSPQILEEGMVWKPISVPPEDAQFLQTRKFQVEEIARWYNVPPHKIGHLEEVPKHTIEQQNIEWVVDTIRPWLVRWEQELNRKLFTQRETDLFVEFNIEGLLRGDQAARMAYYKDAITFSIMQPNEVREKENLNASEQEGMDAFYRQANMVEVGKEPEVVEPVIEETEDQEQDDTMDNFLRMAASRIANREMQSFKKNTKDKTGQEVNDWLDDFLDKHVDYVMSAIPITEENAKEYINLCRGHIHDMDMDNWTDKRTTELMRLAS